MSIPASFVVRQILNERLVTDAAFDAFCRDYFPKAAQQFSDGMQRDRKTNILFQYAGHEKVYDQLAALTQPASAGGRSAGSHQPASGAGMQLPPLPVAGGEQTQPASQPPTSTPHRDQPKEEASVPYATPPLPRLPKVLIESLHAKRLTVMVGAGLSLSNDVSGNFPDWYGIAARLLEACERYSRGRPEELDELRAALAPAKLRLMTLDAMLNHLDAIRILLDRDYQRALHDIFSPATAQPGLVHRTIAALQLPMVLTTNYDRLLEQALGSAYVPFSWRNARQALAAFQSGKRTLFKLHGTVEDHESVILTSRDYDRVSADPGYQAILRHLFQTHVVLFVGFGMNDPHDLDLLMRHETEAFGVATERRFALLRQDPFRPDVVNNDRLKREYNIEVIPYAEHNQLPELLRQLTS